MFTGLPRRWPKVAGGRAMEPPRRAVRLRGRGYQLLVALILLSTLTILHLHPPSTTPRSRGSTSPLVRAAADAPNGGALAELQVTADGAAALTTGGRAADDVHARNAHHPAAQPPSPSMPTPFMEADKDGRPAKQGTATGVPGMQRPVDMVDKARDSL